MLEQVMVCCEMLEQVMKCCEMLKSHLTQQVCYAPRSVHPKNNRDSVLVQCTPKIIETLLSSTRYHMPQ